METTTTRAVKDVSKKLKTWYFTLSLHFLHIISSSNLFLAATLLLNPNPNSHLSDQSSKENMGETRDNDAYEEELLDYEEEEDKALDSIAPKVNGEAGKKRPSSTVLCTKSPFVESAYVFMSTKYAWLELTFVWGVSLMLGYLGFDGFTSTFQDKLFKGYNMEIYNQIFYTTTCSCILSLIGLLLQGHLLLAIDFAYRHRDCLFDIALLSTVATASQFFISYTMHTFGALTFATIMTTRQVSYNLDRMASAIQSYLKTLVLSRLSLRSKHFVDIVGFDT